MLDSLDHPIVFVFFIAIAIAGAWGIIRWGAKAHNLPGLANLVGG